MRSTTPPTSRRTARIITPATWRWCAAASRRSRWCWPRRRRRSNRKSTRGAAATSASICRSVSAARICRSIEAIDMRREGPPRGRFIAPRLAEAVQTALERKEQALLFLNRRGYAPLTLCRACGFRLQCPNCDAWLVDHRFKRRLVCHHCGFSMPPPAECPQLPRHRKLRAHRPRRRAAGAGGGRTVPGRAHSGAVERPGGIDGALARGARRRGARPLRHRHRHPARRQGPPFSQAQSGRHRRRRSRPRQRRSARRRAHVPACCIRWSAAPAARRGAASAFCRRISPSIR